MFTFDITDKVANKAPLKGVSTPKVLTAIKYGVEKFDGKKTEFGMWQWQMQDIMVQQGLHRALCGREAKLGE